MIKAHIGSLLYNSMERQQPRQPPLRNVRQQVTSSFSEVETDSQSDVVDRVQVRNQDFMWGGANEAKVDQTTEMYFLMSDPFI